MNLLIVEDDSVLQSLLLRLFKQQNFTIDLAINAEKAEKLASDNSYDCIVLDLGLPDKDGLKVCESLRKNGNDTPILILSAYKQVETKIAGLDLGADDYLTKPFDNQELIARVKALIRRKQISNKNATVLRYADLTIDLQARSFQVNGRLINLTSNEFVMMSYFLRHPEVILSKTDILNDVFSGYVEAEETNFINVYLSYIRKKISEHSKKQFIKTIRGKGFILSDD